MRCGSTELTGYTYGGQQRILNYSSLIYIGSPYLGVPPPSSSFLFQAHGQRHRTHSDIIFSIDLAIPLKTRAPPGHFRKFGPEESMLHKTGPLVRRKR